MFTKNLCNHSAIYSLIMSIVGGKNGEASKHKAVMCIQLCRSSGNATLEKIA